MAVVDRTSSALPVPYAMEFPDRAPQGALLRPGLLPDGGGAPVVPGLADGVPARGDPAATATSPSTRSSISPSSWSAPKTGESRAFQNACRHRGVKVVQGRGTCETGFICPFHGWCYGPDGQNTFVPRKKTFAEHNVQPRGPQPHAGAVRGLGWMRMDQPRRRCAAIAAVHRAVRHHHGRVEDRVDAGRVVVCVSSPCQLEARRRGVHGAVPRGGGTSPARHPRPVPVP